MAKFEVVTHSTCELVYFVEADSFSEATAFALDGNADFVQTHIGEKIVSQSHLDDDNVEWLEWQRQKQHEGYF